LAVLKLQAALALATKSDYGNSSSANSRLYAAPRAKLVFAETAEYFHAHLVGASDATATAASLTEVIFRSFIAKFKKRKAARQLSLRRRRRKPSLWPTPISNEANKPAPSPGKQRSSRCASLSWAPHPKPWSPPWQSSLNK
jgi:hypothetical protein